MPTGVFAATEDWGDVASGALSERIDRAAAELADLVASRPVRTVSDAFDHGDDFEDLLRGLGG